MTRCQLLAGALGLASWRARAHVEEFVRAARAALRLATIGAVADGTLRPVLSTRMGTASVSELGVTDAVLSTLWALGPPGVTYAVSPLAERHYTGADIAFVHGADRRIRLFQAKVASLHGTDLRLKSPLSAHQRRLLTAKAPMRIAGRRYAITGRLALYQADYGASWFGDAASYPAWRGVALAGLAGWP